MEEEDQERVEIRTDDHGNPILDQLSEEGFVDLTFRIADLEDDEGWYRCHLSASHQGEVVGLDVAIVWNINGGFDDEMNLVSENVYRQGVRFSRSGPESDRLIQAIAELYGLKGGPRRMVDEETFTAIALHQGELDMAIEPVKLKIFGGDDEPVDEGVYYESFFNVDLENGFIFWNEKDPGYRTPLVHSLTATK